MLAALRCPRWLLRLAAGLPLFLLVLQAGAVSCPPPIPAASAAAPTRDRGLLWRITRDGHSSWLFGTLHVGKPAWRRFGPKLAAALQASDVLALEIDPADPALAAALEETGPPLDLPAPLQARLAQAFARECVASETLATLHPVLQATTLTVLDARWLGLDPGDALEQLLAAEQRARGHPVVALESAAQQKSALVPSDAVQAQALLAQTLSQLEDESGRRVLARLAQAWESGDLATLQAYETWCQCAASDDERAFMRHLNDERNPALADGIETLHRQGRRVFAAVGALHMTGAQALPRLLRQRGFKVERVRFAR